MTVPSSLSQPNKVSPCYVLRVDVLTKRINGRSPDNNLGVDIAPRIHRRERKIFPRGLSRSTSQFEERSMKAIVYTKYGTPDVLELKDVARPTPKSNEVLVRAQAA